MATPSPGYVGHRRVRLQEYFPNNLLLFIYLVIIYHALY